MKKLPLLHYRLEKSYIGDVHPYFDDKSGKLLLYYLKTGGGFESMLSVSKDLLSWKSVDLSFEGTPRAKYFVVAVMNYQDKYYSWFGQQFTHVCSISDNGVDWKARIEFDVKVNKDISKFGERDPYVVYDEKKKCFYLVALAYLENEKDCAIVLKKTSGIDLSTWEEETKVLLRFPNGLTWSNGEPECPQLIKIDNRWYLFASLARKMMHHVGPLSYWIGDVDKSPYEIDWDNKSAHLLTSEDLCAAQIGIRNGNNYVFGWIPQDSFGSDWGGSLNFPLKLQQQKNGYLNTVFDKKLLRKITKDCFCNLNNVDSIKQLINKKRFLLKCMCDISGIVVFELNNNVEDTIRIIFDQLENKMKITVSPLNRTCSEFKLPSKIFKKEISIIMLFDEDIVEINVDNKYTLHARVNRKLDNDYLIVSSTFIRKLDVYSI